jgi:hypothetical protein
MEKKKYIEYPNLKRFVNHKVRNSFGRGGARYQQTTPVEDITKLVGYEILQDYFAEKRTSRLNNAKEYNQRRRNDERIVDKKEFLDSLDERMYNAFFKMVEEHNKAFDDGDYAEALRIKSNFATKLWKFRHPEWVTKYDPVRRNKVQKIRRDKIAKSLKECSHVECNLCGMILENNPNQKRRHANFHSTAQRDGRNTTQGRVVWKPSEGYTK